MTVFVDAPHVFDGASPGRNLIPTGDQIAADAKPRRVKHYHRPLGEIVGAGIDNPWEDVAPVTIAQCLEHTAGLDDVRFNEIFTDDETISVRDTLALNPRSRRIRSQPGTRHAYSNVGYTLAARAIEVASGEPFDAGLSLEPALLPELGVGYVLLLNSTYSFRGYFEIRSLLFSYLTRGRTFAPPPPTEGPPIARARSRSRSRAHVTRCLASSIAFVSAGARARCRTACGSTS
jgi:Beta-lactamase